MKYYALAGLFNGLVSFIFGAMVLFHDSKSKKYQTFAFLCFSIFFWGTFYFFWQISSTAQEALFFCRLLMIGAILMPITHYHHVIEVFELNEPKRNQILIGGYLFAGTLTSLSFTDLVTKSVSPKLGFPFWPEPGFLFGPLLIYKFSFATYAIFLLWNQKEKMTGSNKTSLIWVIVATIIAYISGSTNYPLWYEFSIWPILTPFVCIFLITEAFFLFRLRLLDSYLFIRDTTIHILSSLIIATGFYAISTTISQKWGLKTIIFGMALFLPLLYPIISSWIRKKIYRTRWGDVDRYLEDIEERSSSIIAASLSIASLSQATLDLMISIFPVNEASIYFMRSKTQSLHLYAKKGMKSALTDIDKSSDIFRTLLNRNGVFYKNDYLDSTIGYEKPLFDFLSVVGGEILVPIHDASKKICGLLVFGEKISNVRFHRKDLEAIKLLEKKIGIACNYATTTEKYTVVMQDWTHSLNQMTKPIVHNAGMIKEFIHMMSSEEILDAADIIERRGLQLREVHDYITNASAISREAVTGEYRKELINVSQVVKEYSKNYKVKDKNVVEFDIREKDIYCMANKTAIERILLELISNSIRHTTEKGNEAKVHVKDSTCTDGYKIDVRDNGEGIDPENTDKIWEPGWQQKDMNTGASGLGLAICKQIIEIHGGNIIASSPGKGQGMVISFTLPIAQEGNLNSNGANN